MEQLQSIAVLGSGDTTEKIIYFRSNPLLQQRKQSLRNNTFALRKNGKNEKQFVRTENSAEVRSRFLFLPVHMNFSSWRERSCEVPLINCPPLWNHVCHLNRHSCHFKHLCTPSNITWHLAFQVPIQSCYYSSTMISIPLGVRKLLQAHTSVALPPFLATKYMHS